MWNSEHLVTNRVISETIVDHDTSRSDLVHQIVAKMSVKRPSSTPVSATNQCPEDDFTSSEMSSDFEEEAIAKSAHPKYQSTPRLNVAKSKEVVRSLFTPGLPKNDDNSQLRSFDFSEDVETPDTEDSDRLRYKYLSKYQYKYRSVFQKFFCPCAFLQNHMVMLHIKCDKCSIVIQSIVLYAEGLLQKCCKAAPEYDESMMHDKFEVLHTKCEVSMSSLKF